jgi:hypothetical protein
MLAPLSQMMLNVSSYFTEQQRAAGFWMLRQREVMLVAQAKAKIDSGHAALSSR